jgi:hypothetical protein
VLEADRDPHASRVRHRLAGYSVARKASRASLTSFGRSCWIQCPAPGRTTFVRRFGTLTWSVSSAPRPMGLAITESRALAMKSAGGVTFAPWNGASNAQLRSMLRYQLNGPRNPLLGQPCGQGRRVRCASQQRASCRRSHLGQAEAALAKVARGCADLARIGPCDRAAAGLGSALSGGFLERWRTLPPGVSIHCVGVVRFRLAADLHAQRLTCR